MLGVLESTAVWMAIGPENRHGKYKALRFDSSTLLLNTDWIVVVCSDTSIRQSRADMEIGNLNRLFPIQS